MELETINMINSNNENFNENLERSNERSQIIEHIESKICRICFQGHDQNDLLLSPCKCDGSNAFIHMSCLIAWIDSKYKGFLSNDSKVINSHDQNRTNLYINPKNPLYISSNVNFECPICKESYNKQLYTLMKMLTIINEKNNLNNHLNYNQIVILDKKELHELSVIRNSKYIKYEWKLFFKKFFNLVCSLISVLCFSLLLFTIFSIFILLLLTGIVFLFKGINVWLNKLI